MKWTAVGETTTWRIDWYALGDSPVDPYLIWFDLAGRDLVSDADFARWYRKKLPLLVELNGPFSAGLPPWLEIPAVYLEPLGPAGKTARFVTARVDPAYLPALFKHGDVKRFQLELSRIDGTESADAATARTEAAQVPTDLPLTWLGVIDSGCAFAHQNLRLVATGAPYSTRVRYRWDLSPSPSAADSVPSPRGPAAPKLGYGAELGPAALDAAMTHWPDETACYASIGVSVEQGAQAQHGFGVLDLLAGRPGPLVAGPPPLDDGDDAAGTLPVVFVQLDSFEDRATNITSLGVHVLDGLRWMIDRVESHPVAYKGAVDRSTRLVVNISYGGLAGPHDGSSILERAIDELIEERRNLFVVLAAGNSHDPQLPTHASMTVTRGAPGAVLWQVEPDDDNDGFLELWFPKGVSVIDSKVRVRVTAPDGSTSEAIAPNETRQLRDASAAGTGVAAAVMFRSHAANGEGSAMCLIAVQRTAGAGEGRCVAPAGLWKIDVSADTAAEIAVHAWVERDDHVSGNLQRRQQSALVDPRDGGATVVDVTHGLSSLAHGRHTVVVGGYCLSDGGLSESTASGPGRGPGTRKAPDVSAPSDESRASPGLPVAGATTGIVNRMAGTSAAAPSVARWIANWCAAKPGILNIDQLREAIGMRSGPAVEPGPPTGPEVVPGTADDAGRLGRVRIDARLQPALPTAVGKPRRRPR